MHFDQAAYDLALAQERVKLGLPPNGPSEPGLKLAAGGRIIHFDPKLHPRDPLGRFREVLGKLDDAKDSTQRVNMPGGGYVEKKGGKYRVAKKGVGDVEYDDKEQVVETLRRAAGLKEVDVGKPDKPKRIGPERPAPGKPSDPHAGKGRTAWKEKARARILENENGKEILDSLDDDALDDAFDDGKSPHKWARDQIEAFEKKNAGKPDKPKRIGPERPAPGKSSDPHAGKGRTAWKEKARARILNHKNGKEILDSLDDDALDDAFDDGKSPHKWARDQIEAFEKANIIDRDGDGKPNKPKRIGPDRPAPGKPSDPHAGKGRTAWKEKARSRILNHKNGKEILDSLDDDAFDEAFDDGKSPHKWARDRIEAFEKRAGIKFDQGTGFDQDAFQAALAQERADRGLSIIDEDQV